MGPVAPRHVGSSQTRARTCVPCIGRQILNHCATREALKWPLFENHCPKGKLTPNLAPRVGLHSTSKPNIVIPFSLQWLAQELRLNQLASGTSLETLVVQGWVSGLRWSNCTKEEILSILGDEVSVCLCLSLCLFLPLSLSPSLSPHPSVYVSISLSSTG